MRGLQIFVFPVLVLMGLILTGCDEPAEVETEADAYTVYLINKDATALASEVIDVLGDNEKEQVEFIIEYLRNGSETNKFKSSLPAQVKIRSIKIAEGNVILNFSKDYEIIDAEPSEILLCRASIVKSIVGLSGVNTVEFQVEGIPLKSASGSIIGPMSGSDIILDKSSNAEDAQKVQLTLYFSDKDAMYLVPQNVEVEIDPDEQIERTIINLLIAGPLDENLVSTIPKGTKIKDIYTNEGVACVDLSEEFVTEHSGGSAGEIHTIYSIVNSLTELPNISKVKFMIDGEVRETYKGHIQFDVLFEQNYDLIKKD